MKKLLSLLLLFTVGLIMVNGQARFRTVVPAGPVVEGESFTIQYIWEDLDRISNFRVEAFPGLKMINGPISYKAAVPSASGTSQMQNFVFTVLATSPGIINAPRALATYKGKTIQSSPATLNIVSARQALVFSQKEKLDEGYLLKTGEDPYKKISENLFLKMTVDRKTCYVGEPIIATYKLFSRLESRSDIIRNPGFYGFAVHDIANLSDHVKTVEVVNGKDFDVHLLRQVQLYPLQPGDLTIDGMEIKNRVQFSSSGNKEQEVAEGLLNSEGDEPANSNEYENLISCTPLVIKVKPLTEKNRPDSFSGAVGKFLIRARLVKTTLARNEAGVLELDISGKGNFIQLTAPAISWPTNIEGFEAVLTDSLKKQAVPLEGSRIFRYSFVSSRSGKYVLPALSFSFFEPDSGKYRTIHTQALQVNILDNELVIAKSSPADEKTNTRSYWWFALLALPVFYLLFRRVRAKGTEISKKEIVAAKPRVEELFAPGKELLSSPGENIFIFIRDKILEYLDHEFNYSGSGLNKAALSHHLLEEGIDKKQINELLELLSNCETVIYTGVIPDYPLKEFFEKAVVLMQKLEERHSAYL